jgi:hypothetical protein
MEQFCSQHHCRFQEAELLRTQQLLWYRQVCRRGISRPAQLERSCLRIEVLFRKRNRRSNRFQRENVITWFQPERSGRSGLVEDEFAFGIRESKTNRLKASRRVSMNGDVDIAGDSIPESQLAWCATCGRLSERRRTERRAGYC